MHSMMKGKVMTGLVAVFILSLCAIGNVGVAEARDARTCGTLGTKVSEFAGKCIGGKPLARCLVTFSVLTCTCLFPSPFVLLSFTEIGTQISALLVGFMLSIMEIPLAILSSVCAPLGLSGIVGSFIEGAISKQWKIVRNSYLLRLCYISLEGAVNEIF